MKQAMTPAAFIEEMVRGIPPEDRYLFTLLTFSGGDWTYTMAAPGLRKSAGDLSPQVWKLLSDTLGEYLHDPGLQVQVRCCSIGGGKRSQLIPDRYTLFFKDYGIDRLLSLPGVRVDNVYAFSPETVRQLLSTGRRKGPKHQ